MYNKIILVGNLVKDPEIFYTPQGTPVGRLRIASNTKNGEQDETLFIDAVTFNEIAENCNQYLNKGDKILVEGRLRERVWQKDEETRRKFEILVQKVVFLKTQQPKENTHDESGDAIEPF